MTRVGDTQERRHRRGGELGPQGAQHVEGVVRIAREEIQQHMLSDSPSYLYGGHKYRLGQPFSSLASLAELVRVLAGTDAPPRLH